MALRFNAATNKMEEEDPILANLPAGSTTPEAAPTPPPMTPTPDPSIGAMAVPALTPAMRPGFAPSPPPAAPAVTPEPLPTQGIGEPMTVSPLPGAAPLPARSGGGGGSVTTEARKVETDEKNLVEAENKATRGQQALAEKNAEAQTIAAEAKEKEAQRVIAERAKINEDAEEHAKIAQGNLDAENEKLKKMPITDMWADKSSGQQALGAISIALGAIGASFSRGPNYAMQIIDHAVAQDYQMKRDRIELQEKQIARATKDVDKAEQWKQARLTELTNTSAAQYEAIGATLAKGMAAQGKDQAQVQADLTYAHTAQEAFKRKQEVAKSVSEIALKRAETANAYASAARQKAEIGKVKEEGGRAFSKKAEMALLQTQLRDDFEGAIDNLPRPGKKAWETYQNNVRRIQLFEHEKGISGWTGEILREHGMGIPRSPTQGLSESDAKVVTAYSLAAAKAARLAGARTQDEVAHLSQNFMPTGADSPKQYEFKTDAMRSLYGAAGGLSGKVGETALAGADRANAAAGVTSRTPMSQAQKAQIMRLLREHPDDPRAGEARALLMGQ